MSCLHHSGIAERGPAPGLSASSVAAMGDSPCGLTRSPAFAVGSLQGLARSEERVVISYSEFASRRIKCTLQWRLGTYAALKLGGLFSHGWS